MEHEEHILHLSSGLRKKDEHIEELEAKLAAYENAEEQGRLAMLPVAKTDGELFLADYYRGDVKRMTTGGIQLYCDFDGLEGSCMIPLSVIGKTVFLTREEAENALNKKG